MYSLYRYQQMKQKGYQDLNQIPSSTPIQSSPNQQKTRATRSNSSPNLNKSSSNPRTTNTNNCNNTNQITQTTNVSNNRTSVKRKIEPNPQSTSNINNLSGFSSTTNVNIAKKYRELHQKVNIRKKHESISKDMIKATEKVNDVVNQCDYDDEKSTIKTILKELDKWEKSRLKRKSLVPSRPLSYTNKEVRNDEILDKRISSYDLDEYEDDDKSSVLSQLGVIVPKTRQITTSREFNRNNTEQNETLSGFKRPSSAPLLKRNQLNRPSSASSLPASVTRPIIGNHSQYLSNVIPPNCQSNFVTNRTMKRPASAGIAKRVFNQVTNDYLTTGIGDFEDFEDKLMKEQQLHDLLCDLVTEYHYLKSMPNSEETEMEKKEYEKLKNSFQKIYPLIRKHFRRYFASNKEFGWNDKRVVDLNRDIEEIALEEKIRDRVEEEHIEFLTKKLKVNQIRKTFKEQRQKNFLKRVAVSDPRVITQLHSLVESDNRSLFSENNAPINIEDIHDDEEYNFLNNIARDELLFNNGINEIAIPRIDLNNFKNSDTPSATVRSSSSHVRFTKLMNPTASTVIKTDLTKSKCFTKPNKQSNKELRSETLGEIIEDREMVLNEIDEFEKRLQQNTIDERI
ncbi:hypothetical protein ABK040_011880 [Willaertia magna]